jgi:hypothetical protein
MILEYTLKNNSSSDIQNIYAGLFFDWDLIDGNGGGDKTSFDQTDEFAYVYNTTTGPTSYSGSAVISGEPSNYYGIFNAGSATSFSIYDNYTDAEKWLSLSSGITNTQLDAGDISYVNSAGPFDIRASQEIKIAFALAAGDDLEDLRTAIQQSKIKYASLITSAEEDEKTLPLEFSLGQNYPNPFNPTTKIKFVIPAVETLPSSAGKRATSLQTKLAVFDLLGREVATLLNKPMNAGVYEVEFDASDLPSGIYFYTLNFANYSDTKKMVLIK